MYYFEINTTFACFEFKFCYLMNFKIDIIKKNNSKIISIFIIVLIFIMPIFFESYIPFYNQVIAIYAFAGFIFLFFYVYLNKGYSIVGELIFCDDKILMKIGLNERVINLEEIEKIEIEYNGFNGDYLDVGSPIDFSIFTKDGENEMKINVKNETLKLCFLLENINGIKNILHFKNIYLNKNVQIEIKDKTKNEIYY